MTSEEFETWRGSLLTEDVIKYLKRRRQQENDHLINVCFTADSTERMVHAAKITGLIVGLNELIELTHADMEMKEVEA